MPANPKGKKLTPNKRTAFDNGEGGYVIDYVLWIPEALGSPTTMERCLDRAGKHDILIDCGVSQNHRYSYTKTVNPCTTFHEYQFQRQLSQKVLSDPNRFAVFLLFEAFSYEIVV